MVAARLKTSSVQLFPVWLWGQSVPEALPGVQPNMKFFTAGAQRSHYLVVTYWFNKTLQYLGLRPRGWKKWKPAELQAQAVLLINRAWVILKTWDCLFFVCFYFHIKCSSRRHNFAKTIKKMPFFTKMPFAFCFSCQFLRSCFCL